MKLLLDTHVWLWALHDPSRLSPRVRAELRNLANELWLSPISTWEALLLKCQGQDSPPSQSGRVVGASNSAFAGSAFHPRDRASRPATAAAAPRPS